MAGENILVIDDDLAICKMLTDALKTKGYNVVATQNGNEGLNIIRNNTLDVIFTDLKLPDINGIQVLEQVKKLDSNSIVILITAFGTLQTAQTAIRNGAYDYITKPFEVSDICSAVERALISKKFNISNTKILNMYESIIMRLEEDIAKKVKEIDLISKIRLAVSSSLNLDNVLETIIDEITKYMGLEICSILLLNEATKNLTIRCAKGLNDEIVKGTKIKIGEKISGWVVQNDQSLLIEDIENDNLFSKRNHEKYYTRSLISVPLRFKNKTIGVININNKISNRPFNKDDLRVIEGMAHEASIAIENARLYKNLQNVYMSAISSLVSAIDAKDYYTRGHSENVRKYAVAIAEELGIGNNELESISIAANLHDLGKIGIHDYILTKPGKLTTQEWKEMKQHTVKGVAILEPLNFLNGIIELVRQHHERYNGNGYPDGIKGEDIRLGARIISVADAFDAMLSERPYRKAFSVDGAINELRENSGFQFDPRIVDAFLKVLEKNPDIIQQKY